MIISLLNRFVTALLTHNSNAFKLDQLKKFHDQSPRQRRIAKFGGPLLTLFENTPN